MEKEGHLLVSDEVQRIAMDECSLEIDWCICLIGYALPLSSISDNKRRWYRVPKIGQREPLKANLGARIKHTIIFYLNPLFDNQNDIS